MRQGWEGEPAQQISYGEMMQYKVWGSFPVNGLVHIGNNMVCVWNWQVFTMFRWKTTSVANAVSSSCISLYITKTASPTGELRETLSLCSFANICQMVPRQICLGIGITLLREMALRKAEYSNRVFGTQPTPASPPEHQERWDAPCALPNASAVSVHNCGFYLV